MKNENGRTTWGSDASDTDSDDDSENDVASLYGHGLLENATIKEKSETSP